MKLMKSYIQTALLGYIAAITTIVPLYIYYAFFFKETINGQAAETLEGMIFLCIYYIPAVLILSLVIQIAQFFLKKQLNKKVILFIFIGFITLLNFGIDFNNDKPSIILLVVTFVLYSLYCLGSSFKKN